MVDTGGNRSAPPGIDHSAGATDATTPDRNEPTEPQTQTGRSSPIDFAGEQFHTRIGGILYLIHALEDLDIPTAFENGWRLATRLGPWGSLDLIARALLGERLGDVADDATWAVLAMLSPQDDTKSSAPKPVAPREAQGASPSWGYNLWCDAASDYRAPVKWRSLLDEPGEPLCWSSDGDRLWLWSPNGYLVASVRRSTQRPEKQAGGEAEIWLGGEPAGLSQGPLEQVPLARLIHRSMDEDLRAWASAASPAVARRLRLALALESDDPEALWRLLAVEGRLYVTRSHVDLVADLDQVWLPARRAGLDRNPGWLADYGRVVLFHFL
jgi:hypothetical protein